MAVEFSFIVCRPHLCSLVSYQLLPHVLLIFHKCCWLSSRSICELAFQFKDRFWSPCVSQSVDSLYIQPMWKWSSIVKSKCLFLCTILYTALKERQADPTLSCWYNQCEWASTGCGFISICLISIYYRYIEWKKIYRGSKRLTLFLSSLCSLLLSPTASSCLHPAGTTSSPDGGGDTGQWRCWHVLW